LLHRSNRELKRDWGGCITTDDGKVLRDAIDIREFLMDQLVEGHEVLPTGDGCDNFDWKRGCQGHPVEDEAGVTA
jgi:hypothetical protein